MSYKRPFALDPYFINIRRISGVGDKTGAALERLTGPRLFDVLCHVPIDVIDRRTVTPIKNLENGQLATLVVTIGRHIKPNNKRQPYRVKAHDDTGEITLVFFKAWESTIKKNFPEGQDIAISGTVEFYQGMAQMPHPDRSVPAKNIDKIATLEPLYPLTNGVGHALLLKSLRFALDKTPALKEWHDPNIIQKHKWPGFKEALTAIHKPDDIADISPNGSARERLAYDEFLALQLTLAFVRRQNRSSGQEITDTNKIGDQAISALPFTLTNDQTAVLKDIEHDMTEPYRMMRLLQGDVGSGKTAVAFVAMARCVGSGRQATMMAPTETLARQHFQTLQPWFKSIGLNCAILTGRDKGKAREQILDDLKTGEIDVLLGTHALFQDTVDFDNLGLAVIDEQHRFGVEQRMKLADKGNKTDILVMTATPIPRSLSLTLYGDMDVSRIKEKPAGRQPIDTRVLNSEKLGAIVNGLHDRVKDGDQIFWVCPLVEESEKVDLAAAEERFKALDRHFPGKVGLIHGRMKGEEKDAVMSAFANHEISILVSTTVIEVGVDIPNATIMIIDHAERFGLSQLHQLRGRIGRGTKQSTCLLVYYAPLGETARKRLSTIKDTEDGFIIAEADLRLRGSGEVLGTKQSGVPVFKFGSMAQHQDLLAMAQDDARLILQKDPKLETERGEALKQLLCLFESRRAMKYLDSG